MDETVSKGEFATRTKVSRARVSQWISEGKISGHAIVSEGRHARIRVDVALAQLRARLDQAQRSANGKSEIEGSSNMNGEIATIGLEFPIEHQGQKIERITIHRACAIDCLHLAEALPACSNSMQVGMLLISVLSKLPVEAVGMLDAGDFEKISVIVNEYAANFGQQGSSVKGILRFN